MVDFMSRGEKNGLACVMVWDLPCSGRHSINTMEIDDSEVSSSVVHLIAGATAGTIEHCGMYPVDTIKVRESTCTIFLQFLPKFCMLTDSRTSASSKPAIFRSYGDYPTSN